MIPDLGPTSADWIGAMATPEHYQAAIVRLTAQLRGTEGRLSGMAALHKREIDALRAQLAEGLSLEVLELRRQVGQWRSRAQAAEAQLREMRRQGDGHG